MLLSSENVAQINEALKVLEASLIGSGASVDLQEDNNGQLMIYLGVFKSGSKFYTESEDVENA
jgi:hypothetical protein